MSTTNRSRASLLVLAVAMLCAGGAGLQTVRLREAQADYERLADQSSGLSAKLEAERTANTLVRSQLFQAHGAQTVQERRANEAVAVMARYRELLDEELHRFRYSPRYGVTPNLPGVLMQIELLSHVGPQDEPWKIWRRAMRDDALTALYEARNAAVAAGETEHLSSLMTELLIGAYEFQLGYHRRAAETLEGLTPRLTARLASDDPYLLGAMDLLGYARASEHGGVAEASQEAQAWVLRLVDNRVRIAGLPDPDSPDPLIGGRGRAEPSQFSRNLHFTDRVKERDESAEPAYGPPEPGAPAETAPDQADKPAG